MIYKLNGNEFYATYGFTPVSAQSNEPSISGNFDMPGRDGDSEHNWGVATEAFIKGADLHFKGRTITLRGYVTATTDSALKAKFSALKTALQSGAKTLTIHANLWDEDLEEFVLETIGTHTVYFTGGITVFDWIGNNAIVDIGFSEPVVTFGGVLPTAIPSVNYEINGYGLFENFGITVLSRPCYLTIPARISIPTTLFYTQTQYPQPRDLSMDCVIQGATIKALSDNLGALQKLLTSAELLTLGLPNGDNLSVYCRDGFTLGLIHISTEATALFTLKLRQPQI